MSASGQKRYLAPYQQIMTGQLDAGDAEAQIPDPIAVGAVGGSGTRVVAQILAAAGVAMASPINRAGDALEWPPYRAIFAAPALQQQSSALILDNTHRAFEQLLAARRAALGLDGRVGWKVPETFFRLEWLGSHFPQLQYVHLIRHGLDMAYSDNQRQAKNWVDILGLASQRDEHGRLSPATMLEYWLSANELAAATMTRLLPRRGYLLRFERLCARPREEIAALLAFLQLPCPDYLLDELAALVTPPASIGRYRSRPWRNDFTAEQLARLEKLGYDSPGQLGAEPVRAR
ncbi:hypothetical protein DWB85_13805 [Seongchinamella sediminis]|uniref:Sulfotransferase family protein n=1 Tax=Seongchinamella sediminis TaxID=2283635 RepID=A0A3L7DU87_9GAMM|nr:sulfotransferase [Seongchinamella sediminis]RLQ21157.1 hypothetical protein DWB85_13805 [Seongchinamella sediminis]